MRIHLGRAVVVVVALAELGALAGALLCAAFLLAWELLRAHGGGPGGQDLLGALIWGTLVGGPLGGVALPILAMTLLRRTALGRALGYALLGMLTGLAAAALLVTGPVMWPVPLLVPSLGFAGLLAGVVAARRQPRGVPADRLAWLRR